MTTIAYAADLRAASARYDAFERALEVHLDTHPSPTVATALASVW
jgi:hypothetical protein